MSFGVRAEVFRNLVAKLLALSASRNIPALLDKTSFACVAQSTVRQTTLAPARRCAYGVEI